MAEDIPVREIVAFALDAISEGRITLDEFNILMHDKRYHPEGYKNSSLCKYRADVPNSEVRHYYKHISDVYSSSNIQVLIKEEFGIEPVYAITPEDLCDKFGFHHLDAMNLEDWATPTSYEIYEENLKNLYAVCADIKSRFPKFQLMNPKVISWEMKEFNFAKAISTLDKRNEDRTNYMAFGDYYTGDRRKEPLYHIIRHEIGHSLATIEVLDKMMSYRCKLGDNYRARIKLDVSKYAAVHEEEAIAEVFAFYTNPFYVKGALPKELEEIAEYMLNIEPKEVAMDAKDVKVKGRTGILPLNGDYNIILDSFNNDEDSSDIKWYDNALKKIVFFNSHEELFSYVLTMYGVSKEWIDAFILSHPNRKWDLNDVGLVHFKYRYTNEPLSQVIKESKKWFKKGA